VTIRCNWGAGVATAYAVFALATIAFVVFAVRRPVSLVSDNYYAESLQQDRRTEALRNAAALGELVGVSGHQDAEVIVTLPSRQAGTARGTVTFYRASDAAADRVIPLAVAADGRQRVSVRGFQSGQWLVQLRWTAGGREFYAEQQVRLR
jgi:nitrogen fixation protein FixH